MGRRRRLLLLWALLGLLHPGAPEEAQHAHHTFKNVKLLQISMHPTAAVQISSNEEEVPKVQDASKSTEGAEANDEEKTLHDLVGVLQDMVQDIPTVKVQHVLHTIPLPTIPLSTEPPVATATILEPSESETVQTLNSLEPSESETVQTLNSLEPSESETVQTLNSLEPSESETVHTINILEPSESETVHTVNIPEPSQSEPVPTITVLEPSQSELVPTITVLEPSQSELVHTVTVLEPSQSEMAHTVWTSLKPVHEDAIVASEAVVLTSEIAPASPTPILENERDTSEPVVQNVDQTTTGNPLVSVSLFIEKATTKKKKKSFDQLTHGALSNLEQSLENVNKLNGILNNFTKKGVDQESKEEEVPKKKLTAENILDLIEKLIETLKNTPSFVKEDRHLYTYIQTAENYIKEALELTEKAEKKLQEENPVLRSTPPSAQETEIPVVHIPEPLPVPTEVVHVVSPPPVPLTQKVEDVQVEMGKLKAFINLLYGFSPHLTTYTQNTAHKKVAEDIVDRALAVLHAIKSVFCGSEEAKSKQALKQLLQEDMELVHQAMKTKRVS